jgi:hypothetical protein
LLGRVFGMAFIQRLRCFLHARKKLLSKKLCDLNVTQIDAPSNERALIWTLERSNSIGRKRWAESLGKPENTAANAAES